MKEQSLLQTASHILSLALFEMFPEVDLWDAQATDVGFICEAFFPHPLHRDTLPLIEQKMKQIIQEARPIRLLEMVPISAAALLKKEGHKEQSALLSEWAEKEGALVEVAEIGPFHQLTQGPLLSNTSELGAFALLSIHKLSERGIRIEGVAAPSKEEVKQIVKKLSLLAKTNYQTLGTQAGLWAYKEGEGLIYFQKGLEERQRIQDAFFPEIPLVECRGELEDLFPLFKKNCCFVKRDSTKDLRSSAFALQQMLLVLPKETDLSLNSLLHSLYKTFIMLDFDCKVKVFGSRRLWKESFFPKEVSVEWGEEGIPRIDWIVEDFLLRPVQVASIQKVQTLVDGRDLFTCEAFIERILVLVLEKKLQKNSAKD